MPVTEYPREPVTVAFRMWFCNCEDLSVLFHRTFRRPRPSDCLLRYEPWLVRCGLHTRCIEIVWKVAFTGQSFQPKSVGQQQMIQRSVEATEVDTGVKAV